MKEEERGKGGQIKEMTQKGHRRDEGRGMVGQTTEN